MTTTELQQSLQQKQIPNGLKSLQKGIWLAQAGDWNKVHSIAQRIPYTDGA